ncbi:hypothetical protein CYLTODRAFT_58584 [Cylindrobasidium torrendii FP15055 ss-10]|uniref:Uncharacterized protein n=1 Tax=Cylindrobasidium torrendii FP15055 ss-10 TaxID=1314674 RepID=A0A0D7B559_9AGAR|nr:hypothetical protein CYLTODRAFT_58584 [Cylindrobasidium torrendii FP15055 ss-10]
MRQRIRVTARPHECVACEDVSIGQDGRGGRATGIRNGARWAALILLPKHNVQADKMSALRQTVAIRAIVLPVNDIAFAPRACLPVSTWCVQSYYFS